MNRCCDGFQGVGYRKVTSRVNEGGMCVQTRRSKRRGDGNQRRWFQNYYCRNQGGMCYRHNLAEPEGGPRTRWAQKMNTISLRIGSCADVWRAKSDMYLV
jgi:hypothetical protein